MIAWHRHLIGHCSTLIIISSVSHTRIVFSFIVQLKWIDLFDVHMFEHVTDCSLRSAKHNKWNRRSRKLISKHSTAIGCSVVSLVISRVYCRLMTRCDVMATSSFVVSDSLQSDYNCRQCSVTSYAALGEVYSSDCCDWSCPKFILQYVTRTVSYQFCTRLADSNDDMIVAALHRWAFEESNSVECRCSERHCNRQTLHGTIVQSFNDSRQRLFHFIILIRSERFATILLIKSWVADSERASCRAISEMRLFDIFISFHFSISVVKSPMSSVATPYSICMYRTLRNENYSQQHN